MNAAASLLLGLAAGGALGALHFGWLWWSLQALVGRDASGALFAVQALARFALVAAGFALVAKGLGWQAAAAALAGFVGARMLLQRRLAGRPATGPAGRPEDAA